MIARFARLAAVTLALTAAPALAQDTQSPDDALAALLADARAADPAACADPAADQLIKVQCAKAIRIGVRDYYPLFSIKDGDRREGYEVALVDVSHRARDAGRSKYSNLGRALVGVTDLLGVWWLMRRRKLPEVSHVDPGDAAPEETR